MRGVPAGTSFGRSTRTGLGRPLLAIFNASLMWRESAATSLATTSHGARPRTRTAVSRRSRRAAPPEYPKEDVLHAVRDPHLEEDLPAKESQRTSGPGARPCAGPATAARSADRCASGVVGSLAQGSNDCARLVSIEHRREACPQFTCQLDREQLCATRWS